jgi:uncharacterized protein DUF6350
MTILVLVGWIAAPHLGLGLVGVLRTAAVLWLVAHHVEVQVNGAGRIGMLPLGLVALPGALLWWAGRSLVRGQHVTGPKQVTSAALAVAVPYAAIAAVLAVVSRSALATASIPQAILAGFAVAFVATWFGAARALAPWRKLGALMSARSRSILAGAAGSLVVLAAAGALTTAVSIANHVHGFTAMYQQLNPGLVGSVLLLLAQLAYLPNAVLWAIAYMLGPGFAVGAGTIVAPTGSVLGAIPAFPLLAALPASAHESAPGWLVALMVAMPYLAGAFGGLLVVRCAPPATVDGTAIRGFCAGAGCGVVLGVLTAFAGGPLGNGRLSAVGPSAWQVTVVGALEVGIAAAISAGATCWWQGRKRQRSEVGQAVAGSAVPGSASGRSAGSRSAGPGPAGADQAASTARLDPDTGGHVIYLDRWASAPDAAAQARPDSGPSGPSSLP